MPAQIAGTIIGFVPDSLSPMVASLTGAMDYMVRTAAKVIIHQDLYMSVTSMGILRDAGGV